MKQQSAAEYIHHGQTPFFRLPAATSPEDADAVFVGVPFDAGVTYRPGARFAPYELRRVSALMQSYHPEQRVDVFERLSVYDGGNVTVAPFDRAQSAALIEHRVATLVRGGAVPFVVGGDHSIALPVMRALRDRHGELAVVQFDAHLDTSDGETWGDDFHHGTPFRHALSEGVIARGALAQIGIRASWAHAGEGDFTNRYDSLVLSADAVEERGVRDVANAIRERVRDRPLYVSFDLDAVDPAFAPGVGTPVAGGLTSREALRLVRALAGCNLVGMDVVEIAPNYDVSDITLQLGAQILFEGLGVLAQRRR